MVISPIKRKPLNTLNRDELHTIFHSHRVNNDGDNLEESPLHFTSQFLSVGSTPVNSYLRPNYPYKVKYNDCMAQTMDGAWKRFEEQLKRDEELKKK